MIELLVVITVIAVLVAIGAGAIGQALVTRDQTESASRLRQWGIALATYIAENNGALPRRGQGVQQVTQLDRPEDWFNALPPYLGLPPYGQLISTGHRPQAGDHSIFVRPGAKDPGAAAFLSYGMNMNLSVWSVSAPAQLAAIEQPALTVFMAESPGPYASTYPSAQPYSCVAPFHGKGHILFLDGHVGLFDSDYLGVGKGDPLRPDVRWITGLETVLPNY